MTSSTEHRHGLRRHSGHESLEQQVRRKGLSPLTTLDELKADVWESDDELTEFLSFVRLSRNADLT